MNPFLRQPSAYQRTPLRAERPEPKTTEQGVATLRLYDPIDSWGGDWGISAKEFVSVLDALPDDTSEIRLLVNSPGGECWEGLAILNALRAHPAKVTAVVEGIAASSASFIAAGVDELQMMENSELFIHRAWALAIGNAVDLAKFSEDLAHEDRNLASIYAAKAGGTVEDWLAVMSADTFYSADEAVAAGLADKVVKPAKGKNDAAAKAKARFDLSVFSSRTRAAIDATEPTAPAEPLEPELPLDPDPPADPGPSEPNGDPAEQTTGAEPEEPSTEPKESPVATLSTDVLSRLGLTDDADDSAVLAKLDELKAKAETPVRPEPDPAAEAVLQAQAAENDELRKTVDLLSSKVENMSTELAATKAEKAAAEKTRVLDDAQAKGKFVPADRADWERDYDESPAAVTRMLARIADGTAVPVQPAGHAGGGEADIDAEWERTMARLDGPVSTTKGN